MNNYIQGDCLDILKTYPDNQFDLTLTSPPYKDKDVVGDYWEWYDPRFQEILRVTSKVVLIFMSATRMNDIIARYPPKRTMIWGKQTERFVAYSWRYNPIFVYQKSDDYKVNKVIWADTFGVAPIAGKNKVHIYQDPLKLYTTILKMFKGCDSILDPFCGSGTCGQACEELGKDFTGIDIDPKSIYLATNGMKYE